MAARWPSGERLVGKGSVPGVLAGFCVVCATSCGTSGGSSPAQDATEAESAAEPAAGRAADAPAAPPEIYIGPTGTRFRLVGPAERKTLSEAGVQAAAASGASESLPTSLEELAEALRPVTLVGGKWEYIAEEPAYELAEAILRGEALGQSTEGREGRVLMGPDCEGNYGATSCDDRAPAADPANDFNSPNLFLETGCTATMIDRGTAITAAHCLYQQGTPNYPSPFWVVTEGPSCYPTSENPNASTENRWNAGLQSTNDDCLPRWGAGMSPDGPELGWLGCYNITIPDAFRTSGGARQYDYAIIDFDVWPCSNRTPGDETGWRGTLVASQSQLDANWQWLVGFPAVADPGGEREWVLDPDIRQYSPGDCIIFGYTEGTPPMSHKPCDGAQMLGMSVQGGLYNGGYYINAWSMGNWGMGSSLMDASQGQSGSGIFVTAVSPSGTTSPPHATGAYYLVGIHIGAHASLEGQTARRWDTAVRNFFVNNSSFPQTN